MSKTREIAVLALLIQSLVFSFAFAGSAAVPESERWKGMAAEAWIDGCTQFTRCYSYEMMQIRPGNNPTYVAAMLHSSSIMVRRHALEELRRFDLPDDLYNSFLDAEKRSDESVRRSTAQKIAEWTWPFGGYREALLNAIQSRKDEVREQARSSVRNFAKDLLDEYLAAVAEADAERQVKLMKSLRKLAEKERGYDSKSLSASWRKMLPPDYIMLSSMLHWDRASLDLQSRKEIVRIYTGLAVLQKGYSKEGAELFVKGGWAGLLVCFFDKDELRGPLSKKYGKALIEVKFPNWTQTAVDMDQLDNVLHFIAPWVMENWDYFYFHEAELTLKIDEEAKSKNVPSTEYRKTKPWSPDEGPNKTDPAKKYQSPKFLVPPDR